MIRIAILTAILTLTGCGASAPTPKTPAQVAYEITATYQGALVTAVAYDRLPLCPVSAPVCGTQATRTAIKVAVDQAYPAVTALQSVARSVNPDAAALTNAANAAEAALAALINITATLRTK